MDFVEERRQKLEQYLQKIVKEAPLRDCFIEFLGEGVENEGVRGQAPELISEDTLLIMKAVDLDRLQNVVLYQTDGEEIYPASLFDNAFSVFNELNNAYKSIFSELTSESRYRKYQQFYESIPVMLSQVVSIQDSLSKIVDSDDENVFDSISLASNLCTTILEQFEHLEADLEASAISHTQGEDIILSEYEQMVEKVWSKIAMEHDNKKKEKCYKYLQTIQERIKKDIKTFTAQGNEKMTMKLNTIADMIAPVLKEKYKHQLSIHENELMRFESEINDLIEMANSFSNLSEKECYKGVTKHLELLDSIRNKLSKSRTKISASSSEDDIAAANRIDEWQQELADLEYRLISEYKEILENNSTSMKLSSYAKDSFVQQVKEEHESLEKAMFDL